MTLDGKQLERALQYGPTPGHPPLIKTLKAYHKLFHGKDPADPSWGICITTGSQDALSKSIDMLMENGDSIILGRPAYPGMLSNLGPKNVYIASVPTDAAGIDTKAIEDTLVNWDTLHPGQKKPKVVYVIPTGSNPSGSTMTLARKKHLLALASTHDLMVLEDDPYYFCTMAVDSKEQAEGKASDRETWNVPTSLYSMDKEGRVLRFDSFSKVLSAGLRIGYMSGPMPFVMRIVLAMQATELHASSVSQMLTLSFLTAKGQDGLLQHVRNVREIYRGQRDATLAAADKHLTGKARWTVPEAGMFLWIETDVPDTWKLIMEKAKDAKLLLVPGQTFCPYNKPSNFLRASYSVVPRDKIDAAFQRLAKLLDDAKAEAAAAADTATE